MADTTEFPPGAPGSILVCNVGSSTLKLAVFRRDGLEPVSAVTLEGNQEQLLRQLREQAAAVPYPVAVLHRVVHAGHVSGPVEPVTTPVRDAIRHWLPLAPQHNALALAAMDVLAASLAGVTQYAVYDSGLYANLPALARLYALPPQLDPDWPIQRYGFHGLAHLSQWRQVRHRGGERVITVQLGSGCSVTAWQGEQVADTSMGFSPLDGLPMATRSGAIDPNIVLHLLRNGRHTLDSLANLLQRESGLKGLSQSTGDMRVLVNAESPEAGLAIDYFCYQVRKQIGAYCFALGGVDCISFGGGIAEHNPRIRQQILSGLEALGIVMNPQKNQVTGQPAVLHDDSSRARIELAPVAEMTEMVRLYREAGQR